jgi:CheY-like chemotaxis protein
MMRILVVDDDDDVRELAVEILREGGHEVLAAPNGYRALDMLAGGAEAELLFTDIKMPGIDGFDLARRAASRHPALKILYASGSGIDSAADSRPIAPGKMLRKPYRPCALLEAVERLARVAEFA